MQYFVRTEQAVDGLARINFTHYAPETLTEAELLQGHLVDAFSDPVTVFGKRAVMFYEEATGKVVIKYEDIPTVMPREILESTIVDNLNMQTKFDATQSALEELVISNLM